MKMNDETFTCPRCGKEWLEWRAALSRKDNKTLICSECGEHEAFDDYFDEPYKGQPYWKEEE